MANFNLQENAIENTIKADKSMWAMAFFFFKILFFLVRFIIRRKLYRQIFTLLVFFTFTLFGVIPASAIHWALYENIRNFNHFFAIPLYVIFVPIGIYVAIRIIKKMWRYYRKNDAKFGSATNPHAPSELL